MIGRKIIRFETVDSTNNYTANLIQKGEINHGTVILSDNQTNGRGQRGAKWHSKAGENLISSFFLKFDGLSVQDQPILNYFTAISLVGTLSRFGIKSVIKWPNDILVGNKKIAGVLIENQLKGNQLYSSIIGIGLNVNQMDYSEFNGTGIRLETGQFHPIEEIVFTMISEMNEVWKFIETKNFEKLKEVYLEHLWLLNETSRFSDTTGDFTGIIRGVDERGRLLVEKKSEIHSYDLKEITFLERNNP